MSRRHPEIPRRTKRRRTVEKAGYHDYINSVAWAAKRDEFRRSKLFKHQCYACSARDRVIHIHHQTYARLGNEYLKDLVALCAQCHAEVHRRHRLASKGTGLIRVTKDYIHERWNRDLTRPPGVGQWSKSYMRRWMAKHHPSAGAGAGRTAPSRKPPAVR